MPSFIDRSGQRFGRLLVISRATDKPGAPTWYCQCDCGATLRVLGGSLVTGNTKSCGCLRDELQIARSLKHGDTRPGGRHASEYHSWQGMKKRCFNPQSQDFKDYGARGITVCPEWRDSYATFLRDMGRKPSARHSLDRIDVNGDYEVGNCRWANPEEQARNQRATKLTAQDVEAIKTAVQGGVSRRLLWKQYGITKTHLNRVVRGAAWA